MRWRACGGNALWPAPSPDPNVTAERGDDRVITAVAPDRSLHPIRKMEAHRIGALHLAVSVFIFAPDAAGRDALLLQRRAAGKYHCGGLWANSVCSHPDWREDVATAAARRTTEELGLSTPLTETAVIEYRADVGAGLVEHERVHVFRGRLPSLDAPFAPAPAEVAATRWETLEDLKAEAKARPDLFAPWFRIYLKRWDELGLG